MSDWVPVIKEVIKTESGRSVRESVGVTEHVFSQIGSKQLKKQFIKSAWGEELHSA